MIEFKRKYKDINDTLRHIRLQVLQSMPYIRETSPGFNHPADLYRYLKDRTTYKNDPRGVELLQRADTLLNGDYWGTPGAGDCDCFTICALAFCNYEGWPMWIKLAGRDKAGPVHIWSGVKFNGQDIALDLTEKQIGQERTYPYVQKLSFQRL